jgi:hypothetical protein
MLAVINDKIYASGCEEDAEHPTNGGVVHTTKLISSFETGIMHPDHIGTRDNGKQGDQYRSPDHAAEATPGKSW